MIKSVKSVHYEKTFYWVHNKCKKVLYPQPVILQSKIVRLEPLSLEHAKDLYEVSQDEIIWKYLPLEVPKYIEDTREWIGLACEETEVGHEMVFAIIDRSGKKAIGSTRYLNILLDERVLEIGYTWLGTQYQRTRINTECKLLLLSHVFEELGASLVRFKTDLRNEPSKKAIKRIGAFQESIIRNHKVGNIVRDSIFYGITSVRWPGIKERLTWLLTS